MPLARNTEAVEARIKVRAHQDFLESPSVVVGVAMGQDDGVYELGRDALTVEDGLAEGGRVHHDSAPVHPEHEPRGGAGGVKPVGRADEGHAKKRRVEVKEVVS